MEDSPSATTDPGAASVASGDLNKTRIGDVGFAAAGAGVTSASTPTRAIALAFAAATFLGAFLLFLVQPLIARYLLPWFGGGPAVWTTCMLFFQAVLLAGYAYAHLGVTLVVRGRLSPRAHAVFHGVLLLIAVAAIPFVIPSPMFKPADPHDPALRILILLAVTVGLPYFVLSSTGPLLQAWFSRFDPTGGAARTYRLYALSNLGSLLALISYPFLFEPLLSRGGQVAAWSGGLGIFAVLCGACAMLSARRSLPLANGAGESEGADPPASDQASPRIQRLLWLVLPTCASIFLLATTNNLTENVSPIPLLWVLPLAAYLLSFIVAFAGDRWYRRNVFGPLLAIMLLLSASGLGPEAPTILAPVNIRIAIHTLAVFVGCTVCHGELARLRPGARGLTGFYLTIAAGGALGGLLVAVVAPLVFTWHAELPLVMLACGLLALLTPSVRAAQPIPYFARVLGVTGLIVLAVVLWNRLDTKRPGVTLISRSRDFYGVLTVEHLAPVKAPDRHDTRVLSHGTIRHGTQWLDRRRILPTGYYTVDSGVGLLLQNTRPQPAAPGRRVGVVGLGSGTLAAYGRTGDVFRFYEIHPRVVALANSPFTFLRDSAAKCEVVLGDARLSLEREPDQQFDVLVLDAFSGDGIPVHLLTAEAFDLYRRHLVTGGAVAAHVSNNFIDLGPVLQRQAERAGWTAVQLDLFPTSGREDKAETCQWVVMSALPERLAAVRAAGGAPIRNDPAVQIWTDDRANLVRSFR